MHFPSSILHVCYALNLQLIYSFKIRPSQSAFLPGGRIFIVTGIQDTSQSVFYIAWWLNFYCDRHTTFDVADIAEPSAELESKGHPNLKGQNISDKPTRLDVYPKMNS